MWTMLIYLKKKLDILLGNTSMYDNDYRVELLYLVGKSQSSTINKLVYRESDEHKDVLFADYLVSIFCIVTWYHYH